MNSLCTLFWKQISSFHFLIYFLSFYNNFFLQISVLFQRLCYFDFTFIIIKWDEPEKVRTRPPDSPHGLRLGLPPHGRVAALGQTRAPRARVKGKNITSVHGLNQKSMNQNIMNSLFWNDNLCFYHFPILNYPVIYLISLVFSFEK